MLPTESIQSPLPWDIPWWQPDYAIFFGVLYAVLGVVGLGLTAVVVKSIRDTWYAPQAQEKHDAGHH